MNSMIVDGNKMADPGIRAVYERLPFVRFMPGKFRTLYRSTVKARDCLLERLFFNVKSLQNVDVVESHSGIVHKLLQMQQELYKKDINDITDGHIKGVFFRCLLCCY